jgi:hypothetical protein
METHQYRRGRYTGARQCWARGILYANSDLEVGGDHHENQRETACLLLVEVDHWQAAGSVYTAYAYLCVCVYIFIYILVDTHRHAHPHTPIFIRTSCTFTIEQKSYSQKCIWDMVPLCTYLTYTYRVQISSFLFTALNRPDKCVRWHRPYCTSLRVVESCLVVFVEDVAKSR